MKRGVTLVVIALFILGAIAFILGRLHRVADGGAERSADSFIPEECDYVIGERDGSFASFSSMMGNLVQSASVASYRLMVDTMVAKGVVLDAKAERVAICDSTGDYIALHKVVAPLTGSHLERLIMATHRGAVRIDGDALIYADSASMSFVAGSGEWLLIGNSLDLVKRSLAYSPKRDSLGIASFFAAGGEDVDINLFMPTDDSGNGLQLDVTYGSNGNSLLAQGYFPVDDSSWFANLEVQESEVSDFDGFFPANVDAVEWLSLSSLPDFYSRYGAKVTGGGYDSFTAFVSCCDTLLTGDIVLLVSDGKRYMLMSISDFTAVGGEMEAVYASKVVDNLALSSKELFGPFFSPMTIGYMELRNDYLLMAENRADVSYFNAISRSLLVKQEWYKAYRDNMPARFTFMNFVDADRFFAVYGKGDERGLAHKAMRRFGKVTTPFGIVGIQGEYIGEKLFVALAASGEKRKVIPEEPAKPAVKPIVNMGSAQVMAVEEGAPQGNWRKAMGGSPVVGPVKVVNHNTKATEWLVQDSKERLYLFANNGKKLWSASIDGKITGEIVQVDRYKNGKLQYLFSTSTKIYLVDRNGVLVTSYPIKLASNCDMGITVCDYDKNKNYRIFVPRADRRIELFGVDGKRVSGWAIPRLNSKIVSRVKHFRVAGRDYIVVADQNKLYMFDRRGNVRVNCTKQFSLSEGTELSLTKYKGKNVVCIKSGSKSYYVDFTGKEVK